MDATSHNQHETTKFANFCEIVNSRCAPSAKFCKNKFTPQGRRKKARCHDGIFAMVNICEILQKLISTFSLALSKTKKIAVS